jgi:hypothetical protein
MKSIILSLILCSTLLSQPIKFTTLERYTLLGARPNNTFIINNQSQLDSFYTFINRTTKQHNFTDTTLIGIVNQQTDKACYHEISSIYVDNVINVIIKVDTRVSIPEIISQPGFLYHLVSIPKQKINIYNFIYSYPLSTINRRNYISPLIYSTWFNALGQKEKNSSFNIQFTKHSAKFQQRRNHGSGRTRRN